MKLRTVRPSPAIVVALLALFVALSGSAYAVQRLQSGDSLIAQRSLSGNRLRLGTVTGAEVADLTWHDLTLINSWFDLGAGVRTPGWAIDADGVVHLRGVIAQNGGTSHEFAQLPTAARTARAIVLATVVANGRAGLVAILHNGTMIAEAMGDPIDAFLSTSLDGITYAPH